MKKKTASIFIFFVFLLTSIFASDYYLVGTGMEGKRLAVHEPKYNNLSTTEQSLLIDLVPVVRKYLHDYAGFDIIDIQNQDNIQKLQAASEGLQYDSATSVSAGQLQFAEYEAFITISKKNTTYSIGLQITDLTTMKSLAEDIVSNIQKITDVDNSGLKELILKIVPKIGVKLTGMGKYTLSNDSIDISTEQELKYTEEEKETLQKQLDKLEKELMTFNQSEDLLETDAISRKAQLQFEQKMAEQDLLRAQQKAIRLQQQKEKERKEEEKNRERSDEVKEKIKTLSNNVEKIADEIRNQKFASLSLFDQIAIIEKEKKAYVNLKDKLEKEVASLYEKAKEEYKEKEIDIENPKNYRPAELSNGVPIEAAKNIKIKENDVLYNQLMTEAKNNENVIRENNDIKIILTDVEQKEKDLEKSQELNSLVETTLLEIGEYDGEKKAWVACSKIYINGELFIQNNIDIPFNDLAKALEKQTYTEEEMLGKKSINKYYAYLDDVEVYDSLFRMETPLIFLEAKIKAEVLSKNEPSTYFITIFDQKIKSTTTNQLITTSEDIFQKLSVTPAIDIRSEKERELFDKQTKKLEKQEVLNKMGRKIFSICNVGFVYALDEINSGANYLCLDWSLKNLPIYFGGELDHFKVQESEIKEHNYFNFILKVGIFKYLSFIKSDYPPMVYAAFGIAPGFMNIKEKINDKTNAAYGNDKYIMEKGIFAAVTELGFDFFWAEGMGALGFKYQLMYSSDFQFVDKYIFSLSLNLGVF